MIIHPNSAALCTCQMKLKSELTANVKLFPNTAVMWKWK